MDQHEFDVFVQKVTYMMDAQQVYFRTRTTANLETAKKAERDVRSWIRTFEGKGKQEPVLATQERLF